MSGARWNYIHLTRAKLQKIWLEIKQFYQTLACDILTFKNAFKMLLMSFQLMAFLCISNPYVYGLHDFKAPVPFTQTNQ